MRPETIRELERVNLRLRAIVVELEGLSPGDPRWSALFDAFEAARDELAILVEGEFERMPFFKWMFFVVVRELASAFGWLLGRFGAPARWVIRAFDSFR